MERLIVSNNSVKVVYSVKSNIYNFLSILLFLVLDVCSIFLEPISVKSVFLFFILTFLLIIAVYSSLNKIENISLCNNKILIDRFLVKSLTFEDNDIRHISKDQIKVKNKSFNIKFVVNKSDILSILLNAVKVENINQNINKILFENEGYFKDLKEIHKANKHIDNVIKSRNIVITLFVVLAVSMLIIKHAPIMSIIVLIIISSIYYIMYIRIENMISNINSKFLQSVMKIVNLIFSMLLILMAVVLIENVFISLGIDLLKITF